MTQRMTIIGTLMYFIIALFFPMTAVVPVITPLMIVIVALVYLVIRIMSVMTAVMTNITGVMLVIIRVTHHASGMMCLTKKLLSGIIAVLTEPDHGANDPTLAPKSRQRRAGGDAGGACF